MVFKCLLVVTIIVHLVDFSESNPCTSCCGIFGGTDTKSQEDAADTNAKSKEIGESQRSYDSNATYVTAPSNFNPKTREMEMSRRSYDFDEFELSPEKHGGSSYIDPEYMPVKSKPSYGVSTTRLSKTTLQPTRFHLSGKSRYDNEATTSGTKNYGNEASTSWIPSSSNLPSSPKTPTTSHSPSRFSSSISSKNSKKSPKYKYSGVPVPSSVPTEGEQSYTYYYESASERTKTDEVRTWATPSRSTPAPIKKSSLSSMFGPNKYLIGRPKKKSGLSAPPSEVEMVKAGISRNKMH